MDSEHQQTCYIGLGSNIESPKRQILTALKSLASLDGVCFVQSSSLYSSKPHGPQDQPDFINAVAEIKTTLSPLSLLDALQEIEKAHKRVKLRHWGERSIDLDILLYANQTISDERLCIPHSHMLEREFVLIPLMEIAPTLCLPNGESIDEHAKKISAGLEKISQPPKIRT